jgi:hypothetical protein
MAYVRRGLGFKVMNPNDPILQRPHWMNTTTTNDVMGFIENELDKMRRKEKKRQKKRERAEGDGDRGKGNRHAQCLVLLYDPDAPDV